MIRIGSITTEQKCDGVIGNTTCANCNSVIQPLMIRTVQTGKIIFIPFIKKTVCYYTICPYCGMKYVIPRKMYKSILQTSNSELLFQECNKYLQASKTRELQYEQKSDRNWAISWLLALFGGIFGLQHWYMGFKKRGLISILLWAIAILNFVVVVAKLESVALLLTGVSAVCIAFNVYWGLFDAIRIIIGKAKDVDKKYIMTKGQHQRHLKSLQRYM